MNKELEVELQKSANDHWVKFKKVISADASEHQIKEMKLAFYSGMLVLFSKFKAMEDLDEITKESEGLLYNSHEAHKVELLQFFEDDSNLFYSK